MKQIDTLIDRIAERLEAIEMSERAASIAATKSPDAIRYIRSRRAMPSAPRLATLAKVLQATPEWLIGEVDQNDFGHGKGADISKAEDPVVGTFNSPNSVGDNDALHAAPGIPIYATMRLLDRTFGLPESFRFPVDDDWHMPNFDEKRVNVQQMTIDHHDFIDTFHRVPLSMFEARNSYGIYFPIGAMDPVFPEGHPAVVSKNRPVQEMDVALFYLWADDQFSNDQAPGLELSPVVPARIRRIYRESYDVEQFNGRNFSIPKSAVAFIHRIYTMRDFLR